jgi:RNA polymerase sigma-70 factor (ECF subfamily)
MPLSFFELWPRSRRTAKAMAREAMRRRVLTDAAARPGPPAVAFARSRYARHSDIAIDPLETEYREHPDGIEVRAWILVPGEEVPPHLADAIRSSIARLASVAPIDRQIFFLSTAYGISTADISILLAMRRRDVRRRMLGAIACLDRQDDANSSEAGP